MLDRQLKPHAWQCVNVLGPWTSHHQPLAAFSFTPTKSVNFLVAGTTTVHRGRGEEQMKQETFTPSNFGAGAGAVTLWTVAYGPMVTTGH